MTTTKRTYTLTRTQCEAIKNADRVYALNARQMFKNTGVPQPNGSYKYPTWVQLNLKRLGQEAIDRWLKAHPIPSTVIAVAFDQAERRRAA